MTNEELEFRFSRLVKSERKIALEILTLLREAERRRHYLGMGFSTLYDWLTRGHGYSQGAANRRIRSMRITFSVLGTTDAIASGKLNLSTLSMVQSTLKNHERTHKVEVSNEKKAEILQKVMGKSIDETQIILKKEFPEAPKREVLRSINGEDSRLSLNLESDVVTKLKRVRSLLSHKFPYANWSQIVTYLVEEYLKRKDPLTENAVTTNHRVKVQCTFRDEKTGRTCTSTYQLEDDHIIPRAIGGSDEPENFRFLCKQHNLYEAERILGPLGLNKRPTQ